MQSKSLNINPEKNVQCATSKCHFTMWYSLLDT